MSRLECMGNWLHRKERRGDHVHVEFAEGCRHPQPVCTAMEMHIRWSY